MTLRYGRSRDGSRYSQWRCPYYPLPAVCYQPRIVHGAFKADRGGRAKFSDQDSCWVSLSWRLVECTARAVIVACLGGKRGVISAKFVNRNCYACWWKERQNNRASNFPCPFGYHQGQAPCGVDTNTIWLRWPCRPGRPQEVWDGRTTLIIIILKITNRRKRRLFIRLVFNTETRAQEVAVTIRMIFTLRSAAMRVCWRELYLSIS